MDRGAMASYSSWGHKELIFRKKKHFIFKFLKSQDKVKKLQYTNRSEFLKISESQGISATTIARPQRHNRSRDYFSRTVKTFKSISWPTHNCLEGLIKKFFLRNGNEKKKVRTQFLKHATQQCPFGTDGKPSGVQTLFSSLPCKMKILGHLRLQMATLQFSLLLVLKRKYIFFLYLKHSSPELSQMLPWVLPHESFPSFQAQGILKILSLL